MRITREKSEATTILTPGEDVLEVGPRIVPVEFGRLDQAHDYGGALAGVLRAHKKPILAPEATGRTEFSAALLSVGTLPPSRKRVSAVQLLSE